ncbi:MAG: sigma-70 family RNA polymerase sigma factor, partial [Verrucomicrobiales bacterium]|nr:sigma-70 family RNA polymerase sigma factor [Verrucomicrobiales bacterium]
MTDWELIQRFAETRDEDAFEKLVERYGGLVFASARRQVGPDAAADVTQAVFLVLARKASSLRRNVILSSWLFRTTRFAVAQFRRQEARRTRREAWAAMNSPQSTPPEAPDDGVQWWQRHLDDAVAALPEADRQYILVRFFERKRFAELADRFGVSEDAAKKRVARAVDRLRALLSGRGVALSSAALATQLAENRVEAIPPGLSATLVRLSKLAPVTTPGSVGVVELANAAIGSWRRQIFGRWLVPSTPMAVALISLAVVLWAGQGWIREWLDSRRESANGKAVVGTPAVVAAMRERAEAARQRTPGVSQIELSVVDAINGSPISDASVVERRRRTSEGAPFNERVHVADAQGICRVPVEDREFETLDLVVSAPGRAPAELSWASYEFNREILSYRCLLHPGATIVGVALDPQKRPIGGASIRLFTGSPYELGGRERFDVQLETTTDSAGRFAFEGVPAAEVKIREGINTPNEIECIATIVAAHADFVQCQRTLPMREAKSGVVTLELESGAILRGRVTDPDGFPIAGARVRDLTMEVVGGWGVLINRSIRELDTAFGREAQTDSEGHFELRPVAVPMSEQRVVRFCVSANGFETYDANLPDSYGVAEMHATFLQELPEERENPRMRLVGTNFFDINGAEMLRIPDGRVFPLGRHKWVRKPSGDPLAPFAIEVRVQMRRWSDTALGADMVESRGEPAGEAEGPVTMMVIGRVTDLDTGDPIPSFEVHSQGTSFGAGLLLGDGVNGAFAWDLGSRWKDTAVLEVRAKGYLPASPDRREDAPGERRFEFRMRSSTEVWGWVELPNTRPAVGVWVTTLDSDMPARWSQSGDPIEEQGTTSGVRTDRDGRFRLRPSPGAKFLQFVNADGFAIRALAAGNDTVHRLEP